MRKYNKFLALVLCVSMALPFTGCSSSKDNKESTSSETKKDDDKEDGNKEEEYVREADVYKDLDFPNMLRQGIMHQYSFLKRILIIKQMKWCRQILKGQTLTKRIKKVRLKRVTLSIFFM